jgi:iron complex transport system substrate-binding protein
MHGSRPRIISLLSSATEFLFELDLQEQLVGTSHECDYPPAALVKQRVTCSHVDAEQSSSQIDETVRSQLETRQSLYSLDRDKIRELKPDLIITQAQCEVCAVHYDDVVSLVAGDPVFSETDILALQPNGWDDVFRDMLAVGTAVGREQEAARLVQSYQQRIDDIAGTLQATGTCLTRIVCVEWIEPLMIAGNWVPALVEKAGGINGVSDADLPSQYHAWDDVREFDPEVLVICPCGFDVSRSLQEIPLLHEVPGWQEISAVKGNRVFVLDGNAYLNRSGPRLVETVEILAHLLYPDRFNAPALPSSTSPAWYHWNQAR